VPSFDSDYHNVTFPTPGYGGVNHGQNYHRKFCTRTGRPKKWRKDDLMFFVVEKTTLILMARTCSSNNEYLIFAEWLMEYHTSRPDYDKKSGEA
jgi:hypothetical protein